MAANLKTILKERDSQLVMMQAQLLRMSKPLSVRECSRCSNSDQSHFAEISKIKQESATIQKRLESTIL
jgi:hypothetical protein